MVKAHHDRVLDSGGCDERELFLQRGDRLGAVGRVQDTARMRLERHKRGLRAGGFR